MTLLITSPESTASIEKDKIGQFRKRQSIMTDSNQRQEYMRTLGRDRGLIGVWEQARREERARLSRC